MNHVGNFGSSNSETYKIADDVLINSRHQEVVCHLKVFKGILDSISYGAKPCTLKRNDFLVVVSKGVAQYVFSRLNSSRAFVGIGQNTMGRLVLRLLTSPVTPQN